MTNKSTMTNKSFRDYINLIENLQREGVAEGWKEKVGAAALAGAMATGAGAKTPKVPLDQAINNATIAYNTNKFIKKEIKKHKEKENEKAADKQVKNEGVAEGSGQLTDKEILEIGTKWAKEPGWYEFERNDFVRCVKEMLGDLPDKEILEIGTKWAKEPGWYEFERNDFVACVRDIESKLARPRQGVAEEQLEETTPEAIAKINQITRR